MPGRNDAGRSYAVAIPGYVVADNKGSYEQAHPFGLSLWKTVIPPGMPFDKFGANRIFRNYFLKGNIPFSLRPCRNGCGACNDRSHGCMTLKVDSMWINWWHPMRRWSNVLHTR
jgi:hypothetical protein